jgi:hypothetical protein
MIARLLACRLLKSAFIGFSVPPERFSGAGVQGKRCVLNSPRRIPTSRLFNP